MDGYKVIVYDWYGIYLTELPLLDEISSLEYVRKVNEVGILKVIVPYSQRTLSFLQRDLRLDVIRRLPTGEWVKDTDTVFFLRKWTIRDDMIELEAKSALWLLDTRIIIYPSNTWYCHKANYIENLMKLYVYENLGTGATSAERKLSSSIFRVSPYLIRGVWKEVHYFQRTLMEVCQELAKTSEDAGTFVAFDIVTVPSATPGVDMLEFRTYEGQRGIDRTGTDFIASMENRNLGEVLVTYDYAEEKNVAYIIGNGQGEWCSYVPVVNFACLITPFNRIEMPIKMAIGNNINLLNNNAQGILRKNLGKIKISASLLDIENSRFGIDYTFGDKINMKYENYSFTCFVDTVHVKYSKGKSEIDIKLEGEVIT